MIGFLRGVGLAFLVAVAASWLCEGIYRLAVWYHYTQPAWDEMPVLYFVV